MSSNYKSLWSNEMNYLLYINSWSLLLSPISQHNKTNCRLLLLLLLLQSLQWVNPILSLTQPSMTWSVTLITFTAIVTARSGVSYTTHIPNCVVTISHSSIWEYELTGVGNSFPRYFDFLYNFWLPGGWHSPFLLAVSPCIRSLNTAQNAPSQNTSVPLWWYLPLSHVDLLFSLATRTQD